MTVLALALLAVAGQATDACAGAEPASTEAPDPSAAALYRAVADGERTAGDFEAAKVAYATAIARDPADQLARAGLAQVCAAPAAAVPAALPTAAAPATAAFQRGLGRMNAGDRAQAVIAFEAARAGAADPAAALLEAICLYEQGNDARAHPLFEEARSDAALAGTAELFLGLIALHDDDNLRAAGLFQSAAADDGRLSASVAGLSRLARREGRLVASILAEAGYDSNVSLVPDGTATAGGAADGYTLTTAGLFARPFGASGPFARLIGQYRQQLQIFNYDLGDGGGAAGYRLGRGARYLTGEYGYDFLSLGGAPYASVHHLAAEGRASRGPLALSGTYAARAQTFWPAGAAAYSGVRQELDAELSWQGAKLRAGVGYHLALDATRDAALSFVENGASALLRVGRAGPSRITAVGAFTLRRYDAVDPDLGLRRTDRYFDLGITAERDLADRWTGHLTLTARRALSDVPDFQYTKVTAAIGFTYAGSLL